MCPDCGRIRKHYDSVRRRILTKGRSTSYIYIERKRCACGIKRMLPETVLRYKHYESDVIFGVLEGLIAPTTLGFEDYPSEITMKRWLEEYEPITCS